MCPIKVVITQNKVLQNLEAALSLAPAGTRSNFATWQ